MSSKTSKVFYTKYIQNFLGIFLNKHSVEEISKQLIEKGFVKEVKHNITKYIGCANEHKASISLCGKIGEGDYIKSMIVVYPEFEGIDKAMEFYNCLVTKYQNNPDYISKEDSTKEHKGLCSDNKVYLFVEKDTRGDKHSVYQIIYTNGSDWVDELTKELKRKYHNNPIPLQYEDVFNKIAKLINEVK